MMGEGTVNDEELVEEAIAKEGNEMSDRMTALPIGHRSTLLAEQRFYDDTYLEGDEGLVLFILDAALVRGPSGRERLRVKRDVIEFPNVEELASAITEGGWLEGPVEDRDWRPTVEQLDSGGST